MQCKGNQSKPKGKGIKARWAGQLEIGLSCRWRDSLSLLVCFVNARNRGSGGAAVLFLQRRKHKKGCRRAGATNQPTNQACAADARGPPASLGPAPLPGSLSLSPDFPPWKKQQRAAHGRLRGKAIHPCSAQLAPLVPCRV